MGDGRALVILLLMISVTEKAIGQEDTTVTDTVPKGYGEKCEMPCINCSPNSTKRVCNTDQHLECKTKTQTCGCKENHFTSKVATCINVTSLWKELDVHFPSLPDQLHLVARLSNTYPASKINRVQCADCQVQQTPDKQFTINWTTSRPGYNFIVELADGAGGTFEHNVNVSPTIAKDFKEAYQSSPENVDLAWILDGPTENVKLSGCKLYPSDQPEQHKIITGLCNTTACKITNLQRATKYTLLISLTNTAAEFQTISTTRFKLKYTRSAEAVIDSASWTTGPIGANVTVTEKVGSDVGDYVINITTRNRNSSKCVQFRRNHQCNEVDASNCEKSTAIEILDPAPIVSTTVEPNTTLTCTNSSNRVQMRVDLHHFTVYQVSVTPWYCNVTQVQANSSTDVITTKPLGSVNSVDPADKPNVTVVWFIPESPPNGAEVNYNVMIKDAVGSPQGSGSCASATQKVDPVQLCFVQSAGSGNISCSGSAEQLYDFWEYEAHVTASFGNVTTTLMSLSFKTIAGVPGKVTELKHKVNCPNGNGKDCLSWEDPCPQERRAVISYYLVQVTGRTGQTRSIQNTTNNFTAYRLDNSRKQYFLPLNDLIQPGEKYTFKVTPYTDQERPGETAFLTIVLNITDPPKMPTDDEAKELIPARGVSTTENSLTFQIKNTSFLTSSANGEVTMRGMLVAVNSHGEDFNDTAPEKYDLIPHSGKDQRTYRVDFSDQDLPETGKGAKVILGDNNPSCEPKSTTYCDAPLTPDTSYTVYVFACNAVFCAKVKAVTDKKTSERKKGNDSGISPEILSVLVLGVTAWVAIAFLAYFICFRKRRRQPISEMDSGSGGIFYAMRPRNTRPMLLLDLETVVAKKQRDEGLLLREEYDEIKNSDVNYPTDASLLDTNKPKNRFGDVMAFDHTRVKLTPDDQGSDYINANYIPGYSRENEYIATQGPLHSTMDDFWQMVWEHRASIIVMLTQTIERGQVKCEQYWPATHGEGRQYGDVIVTNMSVSSLNEFTITIFSLKHAANDKEELEVMHLHYLKWPDMTADVHVKSMTHFVSFVRQHVRPNRSGPIVVHCSAGIGRTGTYISIDYVMQFTQERPINDHLDIFSFIVKIRKARCRMVQTAGQYILIHQCARHLMATRRRRDLELKTGSSGSGTPPPAANGSPPTPKANNRGKTAKAASVHSDRGEETDSADDLSHNDTVEMDAASYENLMEETPVDARLDRLRQEEEAPPGDIPLATSSMEQLYRP